MNIMEVRKATYDDIPRIMKICDEARGIMRSNGNFSQWTSGYPSEEQIRSDIDNSVGYMINDGKGDVAYFAFVPGIEKTYIEIEEGEWLDDSKPYCTIHRLASTASSKGIAETCFEWCWEQSKNIRIDTHRDNRIMHHCIEKYGFTYCGIIHLEDGSPRIAFQKMGEHTYRGSTHILYF